MRTARVESSDVAKALIEGALAAFRSNKGWADKAVAQLPDGRLHVALDTNADRIAVIMKHVAGNLRSRWTDFLALDGEKSWRNRDDEFVDTFTSRDELIADWESGWRCLFDSLAKKLSGIADDYFSTPPTVREDDYREADRYLRRAAGCPGLMDPCDRESRR